MFTSLNESENDVSESLLSMAHLQNEEAAYAFVEVRIWPNGAVCPHCGGTERNKKMMGKSTRIGLYKCYDCRAQFTVKVGPSSSPAMSI